MHSIYGCHSNTARSLVSNSACNIELQCFSFSCLIHMISRIFTTMQDYRHAHLLKKKKCVCSKTAKLALPFGSGCIPPPLTTLLLSDIAGVMGSDNVLPAWRFRQKQSVNFTGERWVSRPRLSPAISLQSNRFRVCIAHFDIINGVATSVINPSKLLTRGLLSPCLLKKQ